jgi:hypothetical protein
MSRPLRSALTLALLSTAAIAQAQDPAQDSQAHYQRGRTAYDLGRFDEAVQEFEQAYLLKPNPALIFNLAQAHKQRGDRAKAIFYYKRYLALAPDTPNRAGVEARVAELEQQRASAPPLPPEEDPAPVETPRRNHLRVGASAGPSLVDLGAGPEVPTQVSFLGEAAYVRDLAGFELEVGATIGVTPLPYLVMGTEVRETATLLSAAVQVGVRRPLRPRLSFRAQLGGGLQWLGGLGDGNPFVEGHLASSAVALPQLRAAVGLDVALDHDIILTVVPLMFTFSPAAERLAEPIQRIVRFDLMVGVAYVL